MDEDVGLRAHKAAEERLEAAMEDPDFDGCITCIVREVLEAAWPVWDGADPQLRSLK